MILNYLACASSINNIAFALKAHIEDLGIDWIGMGLNSQLDAYWVRASLMDSILDVDSPMNDSMLSFAMEYNTTDKVETAVFMQVCEWEDDSFQGNYTSL